MKKAIVTGANGFVGKAVVKNLLKNNIEVLALGRKESTVDTINKNFDLFAYKKLDLKHISNLPNLIREMEWEVGEDCVFYHFAWNGVNRLTDGQIKDQMVNVIYSANAVKIAKEIGCTKFINCGTFEESLIELFLNTKWENQAYESTQENYALSKLAARDLCLLKAYLEKIDYVHTRISAPIDLTTSSNSYINNVFKSILNDFDYDNLKNNNLIEIIPIEEVAKAYFLIGKNGKNKADYYIGAEKFLTLSEYFKYFKSLIHNNSISKIEGFKESVINSLNRENLMEDVGYSSDINIENYFNNAIGQWKKQ